MYNAPIIFLSLIFFFLVCVCVCFLDVIFFFLDMTFIF